MTCKKAYVLKRYRTSLIKVKESMGVLPQVFHLQGQPSTYIKKAKNAILSSLVSHQQVIGRHLLGLAMDRLGLLILTYALFCWRHGA